MADIVSWIGRIPHFCDVDLHTLANSAQTVQPCVNEKTALIIGVHPVGGHCDVGGLTRLGQERGIPVIFDSVESVHEVFLGKPVGSFGTAELFSIGASKLINGFEGGYITTNHGDLADVLRRKRRGCGPGLGLTVPLPDIHAAMALASLDDLPNQLLRNQQRFSIYQKELAKISGLRLVEQNLLTEPSYKNIVMEVLDDWPFSRDQTVQLMNAERMLARSYYCPPLTHKPMSYPHIALDLPHTDTIAQRYISLPCGHLVSIEDIRIITDFLAYIQLHAKDILEKMSVSRASV
jgi:dTDP-4-amino-4,6-dideoxygalactose transaminase